jgi:hypothetical protein
VCCLYGIGPSFNAWRELATAERGFAERHATHDADYAAMRLVNWLMTDVCGVPMPTSGGPFAATSTWSGTPPVTSRRRAAGRGREDERLLLEAVRRGHPRGVPRFVS